VSVRAAPRATDPIVRFVGIGKTYDGLTRVVDDLNLDVLRGEFLTLLGPSGSGKTTTLMMLAGFEMPTAGEILLDGKPLSHKPPYQRDIGMVFQNYALFPHMTAFRCRCAAWPRPTCDRGSSGRSTWCSSEGSATGVRPSSRAASSSAPPSRARSCSSPS
jgi:hypothetical protein